MAIVQLDTENADRDLTSQVTVLTDTPDASNPMVCQGLIMFGDGVKDLDGTGGDFELTVTVDGQTIEPDPQVVEFSTAIRTGVWTTPFPVPANAEVILKAKSPNGADTDVDVTAYLYDTSAQGALVLNNLDHLLAAAVTGADVVDDSVVASLVSGSGTADWDTFENTTDSLQGIRDAIAAAAPVAYHPDASSVITVGNEDANTYADCAADNGTRWTIGDEDGAATIDVTCEFNMGANRVATGVAVNGYFNRSGGGGYVVRVYAWNYTTASWNTISGGSAATELQDRNTDADYAFGLGIEHTDPDTAPGEVKIRFASTRATTADGDVLYLDHVQVTGVAAGATSPEAIADRTWRHVLGVTTPEGSAGYYLRTTKLLATTVASVTSTTIFVLTAGVATANAHVGALIVVEDADDDHYEIRRITAYTAGRQVTLDAALSFTPAPGDDAYIVAGYALAMVGTDGANTTVPDASGTAAGLHSTTDGLINGLTVPDAAGVAAALHATTDALVNGLTVPDAAGVAAGLHATTDALVTSSHSTTDALVNGLTVPDAAGVAAALHATTDALIGGLTTPDAAGTAAALHATTDALIGALVTPDAAGVAAALHATTDALIGALNNLSSGDAETAAAAALTAVLLTVTNVGKMLAYAAGATTRNAGTGAETYKNPAAGDATTHTLTPNAAGRTKS